MRSCCRLSLSQPSRLRFSIPLAASSASRMPAPQVRPRMTSTAIMACVVSWLAPLPSFAAVVTAGGLVVFPELLASRFSPCLWQGAGEECWVAAEILFRRARPSPPKRLNAVNPLDLPNLICRAAPVLVKRRSSFATRRGARPVATSIESWFWNCEQGVRPLLRRKSAALDHWQASNADLRHWLSSYR